LIAKEYHFWQHVNPFVGTDGFLEISREQLPENPKDDWMVKMLYFPSVDFLIESNQYVWPDFV
jgi:hypothetical protein